MTRSLGRILWTFATQAQKRLIAWQDRTNRYSYARWIDTVERREIERTLKESGQAQYADPRVTFVVYSGEWNQPDVARTLESIQRLKLSRWDIIFLIPRSIRAVECAWFQEIVAAEARASFILAGEEPDPDVWLSQIDQIPGDWIVPLAAGDRLAAHWARFFVLYLSRFPEADIFYWDEDWLGTGQQRVEPFFKPDWSPELLFSVNYLSTSAFRTEFSRSVLPADRQSAPSWIFDFTAAARQVAHLPFVLQHRASWGEDISASLKRHAVSARSALEKRGLLNVETTIDQQQGTQRLKWDLPNFPRVSVVIPTKNNLEYLRRCLSTLLEKTDYPAYEIVIMDDHSTDPAVSDFYAEIQAEHANIRVFPNAEPFNYSRVNNTGARLADGDLLLFLNNDVEICEPGWLVELVRWAQTPGVGMVGAKLVYPDQSIQHAGIVLGMTGHANHIFAGSVPWRGGLFASPQVYRNVSAVTGACMLVRREAFEAVGGFNEALPLVFNDVELCLRFRRSGWRIVYTPAAVLIHYEGRSRARYIPPEDIVLGGSLLAESVEKGDPFYNHNLSLAVHWPTLRRLNEPAPGKRLKQIVRFRGSG